jgi:two-component system sensor histidine kinase/response regulator
MHIALKIALAACLFWLAWTLRRIRHLREQATESQETAEQLAARLRVLGRDQAEAIRADARRLSLTDDAPAPMLALSPGGELRYANAAARELFNLDLNRDAGRPFAPTVDPRHGDQTALRRVRASLGEPPHRIRYEQRLLTEQGWRWIAWQEWAQLDETGAVMEVSALGHDITAHKLAEEDLIAARDEATAATTAKSRFLAAMSHEIRTPLNGIIGMARLLLEGARTGEQRKFARAVRQSGEALLAVINDILDFSRMEAGQLSLNPRDFALTEPIEQTCQLLATAAYGKDIELCVTVDDDVPARVHGDPDRLRQILFNLIGNAIKFTTSGGVQLDISAVSHEDGRALLMFEVRDTGVGIAPDEQARLFEAFRQADNGGAARQQEGTGLGLAIAEHLVRLMDGEIGLDSTPGEGSTFWFMAQFADPRETVDTDEALSAPLAGLPVLVADANQMSRDAALVALTRAGAEAYGAVDLDAAALLIDARPAEAPFAAALVDLTLADATDGSARRLLHLDDKPTAMLALRRPGDGFEGEALRKCGYGGHIDKPLLPWRLVAAVTGRDEEEPEETIAAPADLRPAEGMHVLLAEDNRINQLLALTLIRRLGATADCVDDGAAALAAVREGAYDLVLMDVQMPVMNGLDATRAIRALDGPGGSVPVIALTAGDGEEDRRQCRDAGMDDYLAKPLDEEELAQAMTRWHLPERSARSGAGA